MKPVKAWALLDSSERICTMIADTHETLAISTNKRRLSRLRHLRYHDTVVGVLITKRPTPKRPKARGFVRFREDTP